MEGPDFFPGEEGLEFEGLNQDGDASYRGFYITVNDLGRIFVAGMFSESVDFDPGPGDEWHQSNGKSDAFVVKYTSNGLW
jgi:hypothetical protein